MHNRYWALKITGILVLVFILQVIFSFISEMFILKSNDVFSRPWILITSIFLHGGLAHLMLNGFALALFGSILEEIIGSRRFLILYFISGLVANLVAFPFYNAALGASGAIFGVLGCLTVLRPGMTVFVGYMPMPMWVAAIFWAIQDILGVFIPDNIANFAHLGGLAFGVILGFYYRGKKPRVIKHTKDLMLSDDDIKDWENRMFGI